jgi:hypothetical protein
MSPEQALGRPVDTRSDIYSLGVIAYQIFAGDVPFRAESLLGVLNQHVQTPPKPLGEVAPGRVSPELANVVSRMLAKEPAARQQTMDELTQALQEAARAGREPTPIAVAQSAQGGSRPMARVSLPKWWPVPAVLVLATLVGVVWRAKTHAAPTKLADAAPASPTPTPPTPPKLVEPPLSVVVPKAKLLRHKKMETASTTSTSTATTGVDRLAASLARGGRRIGPLVDGHGDKKGDHKDFTALLQAGRSYTVLAMGKPGVIGLGLALADPRGQKVAEIAGEPDYTATPVLRYRASASGNFRVQVKLVEGSGDFTVGVYDR